MSTHSTTSEDESEVNSKNQNTKTPLDLVENENPNKNVNLSRKIGILIKKPESNFSNGCVQQGIFIKDLLENIGFECEYVSIESDYLIIQDIDEKVFFMDDKTDVSEFHTFLFVSLNLVSPQNDNIIKNIRDHGIYCVNVICGNLYILHQEEFVFDKHNIINSFINGFYDEYWVLEMYAFMTEYVQLMTNKPTYLMPYVWNSRVVDAFIENNKLTRALRVDYYDVKREKVNLLIFEPNMSIHKSSLIPLLIAEDYNRKYKDHLNKVYVFCGDHVIKEQNHTLIQSLKIYQEGKIESYARIAMPSVFKLIRKANSSMNIVISHNIMNPLNFLHLELLHLDIPFVHNCLPFKENNGYYDEYSITSATNLIEKARKSFYMQDSFCKKKTKIIKEYSHKNFERQQIYKTHMERITGKEMSVFDKMGPLREVVDIMKKVSRFVYKNTNLETTLFYNGFGVILLFKNNNKKYDLINTIESIKKCSSSCKIELIYFGDHVDIHEIKEKYEYINYLNISDEFTDLNQEPNVFMSIVFSSFSRGIYVELGTLFLEDPLKIIDHYVNDEHNSLSFFPSFKRTKYMSELDANIYYEVANDISPFPIITDDFCIDYKIITFNKNDIACKKVLGTVCELYKVNRKLLLNTNIIKSICDLNYDNEKSVIQTSQYLLGQMNTRFVGKGILFDKANLICMNMDFEKDEDSKNVMFDITSTEVNIIENRNTLTFKGKVQGKKIPQNIVDLILFDPIDNGIES